MIIRAVYVISRSGLLLVQRVFGAVTQTPDAIMVSSFLTALLQFSDESVKKLAQAFDSSASTITGESGYNQVDSFTYGALRFLFYAQDRVFLVLVIPRASDVNAIRPIGDRILEEFLIMYSGQDFTHPDVSKYESFEQQVDQILVSKIDLEPIEAEISYFQQLIVN